MRANPLAGRVPEGTPGVCAALRLRAKELSDRASPLTGAVVTQAALAKQINQEHELAHQAAETAVQHAVRCGELLHTVKASLKHGEFIPWVNLNCKFQLSTGQRYMKAAKQISTGVGISSLRGMFPSGTARKHSAQGGVDYGEHVVDDADHDGVQRPIEGARERVVDDAFGDLKVSKPLRQPLKLFRQNTETPLRHLLSAWDAASIETRKRLFKTRPKEIQDTINAVNADEVPNRKAAVQDEARP